MSEKKINFKSTILKYFLYYLVIIGITFNIVVIKAEVFGLEKLWNESMLFVNFGILVFFYIRFAKIFLTKCSMGPSWAYALSNKKRIIKIGLLSQK